MPRQRSTRGSEEVPTQISLVESIRRATYQPRRHAWKPYSKGEDAGSSRPRKSAAPKLPTCVPELGWPSAQLKSYLEVAEITPEFYSNRTRQPYQPEPMYPYERTVAGDQEWAMTPRYSMSPATSVDSQPLLDSPALTTNPWVPFNTPPDSHLLQQDSRVTYVPPYSNFFNFRHSQPNGYIEQSGHLASAIHEDGVERSIYLGEPMPLSPLNELGVKTYSAANEWDPFANVLTWEVVDGGKPLAFRNTMATLDHESPPSEASNQLAIRFI